MRLPHVVGMPMVVNTSLTATGTPASGLRIVPCLRSVSISFACARALSAATCRKACTRSSTAAIRSRWARVTSVAETCLLVSAAESSAAVMRVSSMAQYSPRIRGTLNRCCSTAGAWSSACSGVRHVTGTSSRNTLVTPVACEVGGMPSAATSWTCATDVMIWSSWGARWSSSAGVSEIRASRARCATSSRVMDMHAILGWVRGRSVIKYGRERGPWGAATFVVMVRGEEVRVQYQSADAGPDAVRAAVADAFREEWGRVVATLIRTTGDWDLAEECAQDAFAMALQRWPRDGIPGRPGAWLTTAARNRAIDVLRRRAVGAAKLREVAAMSYSPSGPVRDDDESGVPDDRLRLMFTCCHPALSLEARVALTLRTLAGLTTAEIARAFLSS